MRSARLLAPPAIEAASVNQVEGLRRFFSDEAPKKKNYENYIPKATKQEPKSDQKESESKEGSDKNEHENLGDMFTNRFQNLLFPLLALAVFFSSFSFGSGDQQQISFQEFKKKLLEPGLVDHIDVSNKSVAKVYVRSTPRNQQTTQDVVFQGNGNVLSIPAKPGGQYKYYFNIGSVDSFEEKLEEAQEALGVDPHEFVPLTYVTEMFWFQEFLRFAPTLLLLGSLVYGARRMQGGLGVGGTGGKNGRGIFNIGKATITRADKNSKNKSLF